MSPREHLHAVHVSHASHCEKVSQCHGTLATEHSALADAIGETAPVQAAIHRKIAAACADAAGSFSVQAEQHKSWANELAPAEKSAGSDFNLLEKLTGTEV